MPHRTMLRRETSLVEQESPLAEALHSNSGRDLFLELTDEKQIMSYRVDQLNECLWVGHTNTDMDSIGSAVAAALLFNGTATRASEKLNGETLFVLERFNIEQPPLFKTLPENKRKRVCLVDHNQTTQMAEGVETKYVKAIFDHHAIQKNTVTTETPILVDIKPWGSTCTIIARQFYKEKRKIPKEVAGLLMAGILSDTLNLRSPTTTHIDSVMVSMLSICAGLTQAEVDSLASEMFKAKALAINELSEYAIIMGDHKTFTLADKDKDVVKLGFGVIETTYPDTVLARLPELLIELRAIRKDLKLDFSFCAVVDTINLHSTLLVCGPSEFELAKRTFPDAVVREDGATLSLGKRVSRKLDFIPALDACLQVNDIELGKLVRKQTEEDEHTDFGQVVVNQSSDHQHTNGCCMPTRPKHKLKNVVKGITFLNRLKASALKTEVQANQNLQSMEASSANTSLADVRILIGFGVFTICAILMSRRF